MSTNKTYYIYCITNSKNGMKYIGSTYRKVEQRFGQHISDSLNNRGNGCTSLKNAMREFGEKISILQLYWFATRNKLISMKIGL